MRALRDALAGRKEIDFDEAFGGEDRLTQAVTIFALLELYRKGEITWQQDESFGPIAIRRAPMTVEVAATAAAAEHVDSPGAVVAEIGGGDDDD